MGRGNCVGMLGKDGEGPFVRRKASVLDDINSIVRITLKS